MIVLSKLLKKAREDAGLSQAQLAKRLGYESSQIVSNWERGMQGLPMKKAAQFCVIVNLNPQELYKVLTDEFKKTSLMSLEKATATLIKKKAKGQINGRKNK